MPIKSASIFINTLLLFVIFSISVNTLSSQTLKAKKPQNTTQVNNSASSDSSKVIRSNGFKDKAKIDLYKIFLDNDTTYVDTTLSIKKEYKYNYLQQDNFGLMPFANIGQTYNSLTYNFGTNKINPFFGARARHFNYIEQEDVSYYEVPTPWTRLTYKTAFQQGQLLDAFFTVNLSKQFNFSLAYKGLRSLGNYQNSLTSSGNFRFTTNYTTKNNKYKLKGHIVMQDLLNQENGGITDIDVINFTSGEEDFLDRAVYDPNFENAESILLGKRFYLQHAYDILKQKDSVKNNELTLKNTIQFEDKYYEYIQTTAENDFFGTSFTNSINERTTLENFQTALGLDYRNLLLGKLSADITYHNINYGYDKVVVFPTLAIPNRIKLNYLSFNASYDKTFNKVNLSSSAGLNLSETFKGNFIKAKLGVKLTEDIRLQVQFLINSRLPNYNALLYQSDYLNYNWYNLETYNNVNTQQLSVNLYSKKLINASLDISNIDNYTFFNLETINNDIKIIKPNQYQESIQYLRLKIQKEIKLGNFALNNTIMYQNVVSDDNVLNVPELITRNTLYYSNQFFKKAMTLQTGVTLNYFTKYNMNGYDPLLAEFYTQNQTELGGFPRLDFFINAKIRQTRIFLKAEHFNSSFTGYNYFSAPNQPFRDFTVRFGLVWDFFL